jgi:peptide subunit release factor RF-3
VLAAVDAVVMVLDSAKGIEPQTLKLFEVCRSRGLPVLTFLNKFDRPGREPLELLDEIESVLKIACAPATWPIGMGRDLIGIYHLLEDRIYAYQAAEKGRAGTHEVIEGLMSEAASEFLGDERLHGTGRSATGAAKTHKTRGAMATPPDYALSLKQPWATLDERRWVHPPAPVPKQGADDSL